MTNRFDPEESQFRTKGRKQTAESFGERGGGKVYVWDRRIVFAVQVAQVTNRPLLLRGPAGSGKSSLAPFVANTLDLPFYSFTVNARSQARDMMWEFDALGRLNDANVAQSDDKARARVGNLHNYVKPGTLWWAFDRASAQLRGETSAEQLGVAQAEDPAGNVRRRGAVVLIDEIDKADPDVPNNLLEALGSRQFTVDETGTKVSDRRNPLVFITTNEERELPNAFLRRCIVLRLAEKTPTELVQIATEHFGPDHATLYEKIADVLDGLRDSASKRGNRAPSTAEYLDAIKACRELSVESTDAEPESEPESESKSDDWDYLIEVALGKGIERKRAAAQ